MPSGPLAGLPWSTDFLRRIHLPGADAEVGLAIGVRPGQPGEARLLSYNPRRREPAFRLRVGRTLKAMGFSVGWLAALSPLLPPRQGSWILGIEQDGGALSGTLYIEELARFFSPDDLDRIWRDTADALSLPLPPPIHQGAPYILAVDFTPAGATCLKRYHLHSGPLTAPAGLPKVLATADAGHILQRRGGDDSLKVYRCYDYQRTGSTEAWSHWAALTGRTPPPGLSTTTPVTSIGARVADGAVSALVLYTAPRVGRSRAASSPNTSM